MNTPQDLYDAGKKAIEKLEAVIADADELATTQDQKAKIGAIDKVAKTMHRKIDRLVKEIPDVILNVGGDGK